jgi:hypothetical protein
MNMHATPDEFAMSREQRIVACRRALALLLIHHGDRPPGAQARRAVARLRGEFVATWGGYGRRRQQAVEAAVAKPSRRRRGAAGKPVRGQALGDDLAHLQAIAATVLLARGLSEPELFSPRQYRALAQARHEIMYRASKETDLSLPQIGRFLGRDHKTVMHGIAKHAERIGAPPGDGEST